MGIGVEFGLDDNFHLVSFLLQQYTMFQIIEKDFDSIHALRPKTHPGN